MSQPDDAREPLSAESSPDPTVDDLLIHSGVAFDVGLLDGGTRPLLRRPGNWLVLRAGRPILLAELGGRRLTALASANRDDLTAATACLPALAIVGGSTTANRHEMTVEEWNGEPVTTTVGREYPEAVGFVRNYQTLTL
jgi:ATP-dependent helicase Lhr and Lhr-like helicase